MDDIKRWYDKSSKLKEMLLVLSDMSEGELDRVAQYLYQVVNIVWKQKKTDKETVSIGLDKLFGYYKAYNKRRWYDKNASLSSAVNLMSTMDEKDLDDIVDGFLFALRDAGLYNIYREKKRELELESREKDK